MAKLKQQVYDELLVLRSQDGEASAMDELVRRWQKKLRRHARYLTAGDEAAWDMTQETWMAVVRGIRRLDDPATFKTWVYRILVHKCADWLVDTRPALRHCRRHDGNHALYRSKPQLHTQGNKTS